MDIRKTGLVILPALLCGVAIGYFIPRTEPPAPAPKQVVKASASKPAAADDAALNRLRMRIRDLERKNAELARARAEKPASDAVAAAAPTNRPGGFFGRNGRHGPPSMAEMRAHIEELRKNDPQRYAQITNHFAHMRARVFKRAQDRLDILASVNTSGMTAKQKETHDQYQELLARQQELRELMNPQNEDVTDAQRDAAFKEMREIDQKLRATAADERETLLSQAAESFGVTGDDAAEFAETMKAVFQATETHGGRGGGPGGGGAPPPPPR